MNKKKRPVPGLASIPPQQIGHMRISVADQDRILSLLAQGRPQDAAWPAQQLTAIFPGDPFGWKALGICFGMMRQHSDASVAFRRAIALTPEDASLHANLGNVLKEMGDLDASEASFRTALSYSPDHPEILCNLAVTLLQAQRVKEAELCFRQAISLAPDFGLAMHNLGNLLRNDGQLQEAEALLRRAADLSPDDVVAANDLSVLLIEMGRANEAVAILRRLLSREPGYIEARNNLGVALMKCSELPEAESCLRSVTTAYPSYPKGQLNLGRVLQLSGKLGPAIDCLNNALRLDPSIPGTRFEVATWMIDAGDIPGALEIAIELLSKDDSLRNRQLVASCLRSSLSESLEGTARNLLAKALTEAWIRPSHLMSAAQRAIKGTGYFLPALSAIAGAGPVEPTADALSPTSGFASKEFVTDPLFIALMTSAPVSDLELERFLTWSRKVLLSHVVGQGADHLDSSDFAFACLLAQQCFINEYVFACSEREELHVAQLQTDASTMPLNEPTVVALQLAIVACYKPLHEIPAIALQEVTWPDCFAAVVKQQLSEPEAEQRIRNEIPKISAIDPGVSRAVGKQYEDNPYPRWVKAPEVQPENSILDYLKGKFPLVPIAEIPNQLSPAILIAGCGTGQQPIQTARRFPQSSILAIDLSRSSLAYAKRKTEDLNLSNLKYCQADILQLQGMERSFDVIECAGVLHHLRDPFAGWERLLECLRAGGVMMIGLYSQAAREHLADARALIARLGSQPTQKDIRAFRADLSMHSEYHELENSLASTSDYFSSSACRDLLFHVEEHTMNLAEISSFLAGHQLKFLGFDLPGETLANYRKRFPGDPSAVDLDAWSEFELESPHTFYGMYQFWVQKPL